MAEANEQINGAVDDNKKVLLSNASDYFKQLRELLSNLKMTSKTSTEEIKGELAELQSLISNELSSLSTLVKVSFEESDKKAEETRSSLITELHEAEEGLKKRYDELSEQFGTTAQTISKTFDEQNTILSSYHEETNTAIQTTDSQQKEIIEQKYKKLFTISFSFGIANTIGIITMIVLYLLK